MCVYTTTIKRLTNVSYCHGQKISDCETICHATATTYPIFNLKLVNVLNRCINVKDVLPRREVSLCYFSAKYCCFNENLMDSGTFLNVNTRCKKIQRILLYYIIVFICANFKNNF